MRNLPYYIYTPLLFLAALLGLPACDDYDKFSTDYSHALYFSVDTVRFDTLISTVGSTTRLVKVYNPHDEGIHITSVRLKGGARTAFRVNVDGEYLVRPTGAIAYDFDVYGGDSLYVRAEVTVPESGRDAAFNLSDTLVFTLASGRVQELVLKVVGQDAYIWRGKVMEADTTLRPGRPFVIHDSLVVAAGATLTLEPGVQLYFHDRAELRVRGTLSAQGTLGNEVVFRGDRTDRLFAYLPYDNTPSRWAGIRFYPESMNNHLTHADIHSATYGIRADSSLLDEEKLRIENSILHNIGGDGLHLLHSRAVVANTQISNTLGDCVYIAGGEVDFIHCTLSQFYPWEALCGQALYLTNHLGEYDYPLHKAHFLNCLITGYGDDVIQGALTEPEEDTRLNYLFASSYLNTVESDDAERFVAIVYDTDDQPLPREKNFRRFDTRNFLYDFRLKEASAARNIADPSVSESYPFDRYGISRTLDEGPDAGCYEYTPPVEP